jgi:hypothetical protein
MTFIDRFLVLTAILSGLLLAQSPAFAEPDNVASCTDDCQQTAQYYDCVKNHAYKYETDDCYHCVARGAGSCEKRTNMPGGECKPRDLVRKWHYVTDFTKVCPCEGFVTRVEISGGTKLTEWDMFPGDVYFTCEKAPAAGGGGNN